MKAIHLRMFALVAPLLLFGCGGGDGIHVDIGSSVWTPGRSTDFVAREPFAFSMSGAGRARLVLTGINGTVAVTAAPRGQAVTVAGERKVLSDTLADAQAHLPQVQVEVQEAGSDILVRTRQPQDSGGRSFEVNYQISLPAAFELSISNVNGSIALNGISGNVDTSLVNGRSEATLQVPAGGSVRMTSVNGDIDLHVPSNVSAVLSAEVGIGSIVLRGLAIHDEMRSDTMLQGTAGAGEGAVSLRTTIGSIRIDGVN